jgi:hypothetical protein
MPTVAQKPRRSKTKPEFSCHIVSAVVEINGVQYVAEPIDPHEEGIAALRLSKMSGDGVVYDLVREHSGRCRCDCPHFVARIEGLSEDLCKHLRAAVELGLLPKPKPSMAADRRTKPAPEPEPEPKPEPEPTPIATTTTSGPAPTPDGAAEEGPSAPAPRFEGDDTVPDDQPARPAVRPVTAADHARRAAFGI